MIKQSSFTEAHTYFNCIIFSMENEYPQKRWHAVHEYFSMDTKEFVHRFPPHKVHSKEYKCLTSEARIK